MTGGGGRPGGGGGSRAAEDNWWAGSAAGVTERSVSEGWGRNDGGGRWAVRSLATLVAGEEEVGEDARGGRQHEKTMRALLSQLTRTRQVKDQISCAGSQTVAY